MIKVPIWSAKSARGAWKKYGTFRKAAKRPIPFEAGGIFIVDYLAHLGVIESTPSSFSSKYWGSLIEILEQRGEPVNYLHIHSPAGALQDINDAQRIIDAWNTDKRRSHHLILQRTLTTRVFFRSCADYLKIWNWAVRLKLRLRSKREASGVTEAVMSFWNESFSGPGAFQTALLANLFEEVLGSIPRQSCGIYLQEGQPWEFAFIAAWRRLGHGKLIGVPHSTIRYWDLRYARDPRTYKLQGATAMPRPDYVAVNGPAAKRQLLSDGYPEQEIVEVEALRYLHLLQDDKAIDTLGSSETPRALLLGEYELEQTEKLIACINEARKLASGDFEVRVRPHPATPKNPDYCALGMHISDAHDARSDVRSADVVIAMSTTSAVLDAYCLGIPVIVLEDTAFLNGSPLLGHKSVPFVQTPRDLAKAIDAILADPPPRVFRGHEFFFLDKELPRWRALLGLD
jgi:surface carbohydrate biosynthesis protein (TIGR04326 family)